MSVHDLENGTRVVRLGQGTTAITTVYVEDSKVASGICLAPVHFDGSMKGEEVIIEITNTAGVVSYLRALADMLTTWEITGEDHDKIIEVKKQFEELHKKLNEMG